jgi:hypothetical protein
MRSIIKQWEKQRVDYHSKAAAAALVTIKMPIGYLSTCACGISAAYPPSNQMWSINYALHFPRSTHTTKDAVITPHKHHEERKCRGPKRGDLRPVIICVARNV